MAGEKGTDSAADQQTMSEDEYRSRGGLNEAIAKVLARAEDQAVETLEDKWSKQSVTRLRESASRLGVSPLELLAKWVRTA